MFVNGLWQNFACSWYTLSGLLLLMECVVVMVTKKKHVENGDNLVNKYLPNLFHKKIYWFI